MVPHEQPRTVTTLAPCAAAAGHAQDDAHDDTPQVLVQAHRGYSEAYPENTLLAVRKAFEAGVDRVEVDLGLSEDGHLVLMHDRTVERTTDGEGAVAFMTLAELRDLDAGSWKGPEFAGEPVPTLAEALNAADGRGELNLEIKATSMSPAHVRKVIEAAVALVREHDTKDRVVFSSFDFRALQLVQELDPELRLMLIDWDEPSGSIDWLDVAIAHGFYGWTPRAPYATAERLARAREAGLYVQIDSEPDPKIPAWVEWGAGGFSADDPRALVEFLERRGLR